MRLHKNEFACLPDATLQRQRPRDRLLDGLLVFRVRTKVSHLPWNNL